MTRRETATQSLRKQTQVNYDKQKTNWVGTWRNQYGSTLEITSETSVGIEGVFRTALKESNLYGQEPGIVGIYLGDLLSFAVGGSEETNQIVVGYTGILRDGKIETLWHMVTGEKEGATISNEMPLRSSVKSGISL